MAFDKDMFMKLLIAQMKNQNPEQPVSNAEMTAQISSLAMVEGMNNMSASFGEMLKLQKLLGGTEIIGRQVEYMRDGAPTIGTVEGVGTSGEQIRLTVGGEQLSLDQVQRVL